MQKLGIEDLEAISTFMGSKSYVMGGEKPSEIDIVLFAFISVIVNTSPDNSIYKTLVEKRLTNLNQHMLRMKAKIFPDWDELLRGKEPDSEETPPEDVGDTKKSEAAAVPAPPRPAAPPAAAAAKAAPQPPPAKPAQPQQPAQPSPQKPKPAQTAAKPAATSKPAAKPAAAAAPASASGSPSASSVFSAAKSAAAAATSKAIAAANVKK